MKYLDNNSTKNVPLIVSMEFFFNFKSIIHGAWEMRSYFIKEEETVANFCSSKISVWINVSIEFFMYSEEVGIVRIHCSNWHTITFYN